MKSKIKLLFIILLVFLAVRLGGEFIFYGNIKPIFTIKNLRIPKDTTYILTNYIENNGIIPDKSLKTEFLFIDKSGYVIEKYILYGQSYRTLRENKKIYFINNNDLEGFEYNLSSREFRELDENVIISKATNSYSDIIYKLKRSGKIKEKFQFIYEDIRKQGNNYYFIGGDNGYEDANKSVFIYDSLKCEISKLDIKIDRIKYAIEISNKHYIQGDKINRQLTDNQAQDTTDDTQIYVYNEESQETEEITLEELEYIKKNSNNTSLKVFNDENRFVYNDEYILICNKVNNHNEPIQKNIIIDKYNNSIECEEIDMRYYTAKQIDLNNNIGAIYGVDNINPAFILRVNLESGKVNYIFISGINRNLMNNFNEGINDFVVIQ